MPAEDIFVHILIDTLFLLVILKNVNKLCLYNLEPKQVLKLNIKVVDFSIILITLIISSIMRAKGGVFSCSTIEWWGLFYRLSLCTDVGLQQLDRLMAVHWPLRYPDLVNYKSVILTCTSVKLLAGIISLLNILLNSTQDCVKFDVGYICPCISVFHIGAYTFSLMFATVSVLSVSVFCLVVQRRLDREIHPVVTLPTVSGGSQLQPADSSLGFCVQGKCRTWRLQPEQEEELGQEGNVKEEGLGQEEGQDPPAV